MKTKLALVEFIKASTRPSCIVSFQLQIDCSFGKLKQFTGYRCGFDSVLISRTAEIKHSGQLC